MDISGEIDLTREHMSAYIVPTINFGVTNWRCSARGIVAHSKSSKTRKRAKKYVRGPSGDASPSTCLK